MNNKFSFAQVPPRNAGFQVKLPFGELAPVYDRAYIPTDGL